MTGGGWLRLISWFVPQKDTVAHAYIEHGIPSRSLCELARWNVLARRVRVGQPETPALCPVCRVIVRGAASGLLDEIADLEGARAQAELDAVIVPVGDAADVLRALFGDRQP